MSIDIVYDCKFIKTTRGYIPTILVGSSNCYEIRYDKRGRSYQRAERAWTPYNQKIVDVTEDSLLKWVEAAYTHTDGELFRYHGKFVCGKNIRSWFIRAINNAHTVEQYLNANRLQYLKCVLVTYMDKNNTSRKIKNLLFCETTKELEAWIDQTRKIIVQEKAMYPNGDWYMVIGFNPDMKLLNPHILEGPVVAKHKSSYVNGYNTNGTLHFTENREDAFVFESMDAAQATLGTDCDVRFELAENAVKPRNIVLQFASGEKVRYVFKRTRSNLYSTTVQEKALHFLREYEAKRYVKRLRNDGFSKEQIGTFLMCDLSSNTSKEINL